MNPTFVTAWATVVLAVVAGISIVANFLLVRSAQRQVRETTRLADETAKIIEQNRDLISASLREAEAVEIQAKASIDLVMEARHDRELAHRPNLVFDKSPGGRQWFRNNGRGVAKHCCFVTAEPVDSSTIHHSPLFDIGPGEVCEAPPVTQEGDSRIAVIEDIATSWRTREAIVCEDQLGNKFRFFRERPAQICRPGDEGEPPRWAGWY